MNGLFFNKIFKDKPLLERQQLITTKCVFDIKYKENRTVLQYKTWLVTKDFI